MFYKFGGKQLYYFNTKVGQGEIDAGKMMERKAEPTEPEIIDEAACESCTI
jgi:hypothetical protein